MEIFFEKKRGFRRNWQGFLIILAFFMAQLSVTAKGLKIIEEASKFKLKHAKNFEFVGDNLIARGSVEVIYDNMQIKADKAIINTKNWDFEADGNVSFVYRYTDEKTITYEQLEQLKKDAHTKVVIVGYVNKATGVQLIDVAITRIMINFTASRVTGNIKTGALEFKNFFFKAGSAFVSAPEAVRDPNGKIVVKDAKFSTCEYMQFDQEHYSIKAGKAVIYPRGHEEAFNWAALCPWEEQEAMNTDLKKYNADPGEHTIWAENCTMNIGDVPVMWLPVVYKPNDPDWHLFQVQGGYDSDWGAYALMSKKFTYNYDAFEFELTPRFDLYSKRGIGWGADMKMRSETSKTEVGWYGIFDNKPYGTGTSGDFLKENSRLKIPTFRQDLRISHLQHITPRLDFRGHLEVLSDINFLDDYFIDRAKSDPQPITFADLEYQFDWATVSANVRPRLNDFFTTVERLPEIRMDIQRRELFKNIYYEGGINFSYLQKKWRDFDRPRTAGNKVDPKDYESFRFDTRNMFYYPFTPADLGLKSMSWLNIIPRAGFRVTTYSRTSKQKIRTEDLEAMFIADQPDGDSASNVINYDSKGGAKGRFVGEMGLEMNTKIYNSWQNVKSAYFQLDGLRHVIKPYMNYTFIPKPTLDRRKIYYFDEVDRIDENHFIRLGVSNKLQTRRGAPGNEEIYEWASLENYFDFHMHRQDNYNHFGDIGTRLKFNPFPNLQIATDLLFNANEKNAPNSKTDRAGNIIKAKGVSTKWLNRWQTSIRYKIIEDLEVFGKYNFQNSYRSRNIYSMGSTLDFLNSTSSFSRYYGRFQTLSGGIKFNLPFDDRKTHIALEALYDVEAGFIRENKIKIVRKLHCWEAALELAQRRSRDGEGGKETKNSVMFMLYLTQTPGQDIKLRQTPGSRSITDL